MPIKQDQVARDVRVKFNKKFEPKSLSEENLVKDEIIFISDYMIHNDSVGHYVILRGYTPNKNGGAIYVNSGYAYLDEIDLEFPIEY